jgi:hypothetical protein
MDVKVSEIKVTTIEYHRNGVTGEGFYIVLFVCKKQSMMAVVFDTIGHVAVFNVDLLAIGNVTFGENSWAGDCFEKSLRDIIEQDEIDKLSPMTW